jgi:anti-sigma regulatory factor (Ser/Thr protein kinase)
MQIERNGNKIDLDLSVDEALIIQEQLANAVRHALRHKVSSFSFAAVLESSVPGTINISVENRHDR